TPDGNDVESSHTIVVEVESCEMVIPTGFPPNDDGIQDTWRIPCLERYSGVKVEIFNRWGNKVYENNRYGNNENGNDAWWDGFSTNKGAFGNEKLPAGTYYYLLHLQEGRKPVSGFVFLNR